MEGVGKKIINPSLGVSPRKLPASLSFTSSCLEFCHGPQLTTREVAKCTFCPGMSLSWAKFQESIAIREAAAATASVAVTR